MSAEVALPPTVFEPVTQHDRERVGSHRRPEWRRWTALATVMIAASTITTVWTAAAYLRGR